jgi:hypothetical protein
MSAMRRPWKEIITIPRPWMEIIFAVVLFLSVVGLLMLWRG